MQDPLQDGPAPHGESHTEIVRRDVLARDLRRTNTAWGLILLAILGLAVGLIGKANQAARDAHDARRNAAEARHQAGRAEAELWNARFAEARAIRLAGGPGARSQATDLLTRLAQHPALSTTQRLQLRNEAIALFPLLDTVRPKPWVTQEWGFDQNWDQPLRRYVQSYRTNLVQIRSYPDAQSVQTLAGPDGFQRHEGRFSPDGLHFATVFADPSESLRVACCWRLDSGALVLSNRTTSLHWSEVPEFTPDGRSLAIFTTAGMELHPLVTNAPALILPKRPAFAFSPDGAFTASADGRRIDIWSNRTGRRVAFQEFPFDPACIAWDSLDCRIAAGSHSGQLVLWEFPPGSWQHPSESIPKPGRLRSLEGHRDRIVGLTFTPAADHLLTTAWDGFSVFWDTRTGRSLLAESRWSVASIGPQGTNALARLQGGFSQGPASFLNRTGYRTVLHAPARPTAPSGMRFSPDDSLVATEHPGESRLWDARTGLEIARVPGRAPVFLDQGRVLLTASNNTLLRFTLERPAQGPPTPRFNRIVYRDTDPRASFNSITPTRDHRRLAVAAGEGGVRLVDPDGTEPVERMDTPAHFAELAPDGAWLVSQMHNRIAWYTESTNLAHPRQLGLHLNLAFSPDGSRLGASTVRGFVLLRRDPSNTNGWSRVFGRLLEVGSGGLAPIAFAPDGNTVAVVDHRSDIRLFRTRDGLELATFTPPSTAQIRGRDVLAFSSDGHRLRALRDDGELVEWEIPTLRRALAQLDLDWSEDEPESPIPVAATNTATAPPAAASAEPPASGLGRTGIAAVAAALVALAAGFALFLRQRSLLAAHARAQSLARERQRELDDARSALFQAQKMEALGTLAAGVAHDFNNLLSVIRMSGQLVRRDVQPDGVALENLKAIERAVAQGKSLVNSMLGYSRRPAEDTGGFDPAQAIHDTTRLLSRQFLSGLDLTVDLPRDLPRAQGAAARLEQVLLNLLINAAEAMRGHGSLRISASTTSQANPGILEPRPATGYVEIAVVDSGPGIPPGILPRIFEPFFTTKDSGSRRGTGLGLSLVYTIARTDGWGLQVASQPGHGTTFRLQLPALPAPDGRGLPAVPPNAPQ